jgi:uncharacterized protein YqgV (UPF0045/DUF77 family)
MSLDRPGPNEDEKVRSADAAVERVQATACQFSVYPLRQPSIGESVESAIAAAAGEGVQLRAQNLSTLMYGDEEQIFAALRAAFRAAQRGGSAVLVATLASGMPSDGEVARIQEARVPQGGGHA